MFKTSQAYIKALNQGRYFKFVELVDFVCEKYWDSSAIVELSTLTVTEREQASYHIRGDVLLDMLVYELVANQFSKKSLLQLETLDLLIQDESFGYHQGKFARDYAVLLQAAVVAMCLETADEISFPVLPFGGDLKAKRAKVLLAIKSHRQIIQHFTEQNSQALIQAVMNEPSKEALKKQELFTIKYWQFTCLKRSILAYFDFFDERAQDGLSEEFVGRYELVKNFYQTILKVQDYDELDPVMAHDFIEEVLSQDLTLYEEVYMEECQKLKQITHHFARYLQYFDAHKEALPEDEDLLERYRIVISINTMLRHCYLCDDKLFAWFKKKLTLLKSLSPTSEERQFYAFLNDEGLFTDLWRKVTGTVASIPNFIPAPTTVISGIGHVVSEVPGYAASIVRVPQNIFSFFYTAKTTTDTTNADKSSEDEASQAEAQEPVKPS